MNETGFVTLFINAFGTTPEAAGFVVEKTASGNFAARRGDQVLEMETYGGRIMGWNLNGERHAEFKIHPRDEAQASERLAALAD